MLPCRLVALCSLSYPRLSTKLALHIWAVSASDAGTHAVYESLCALNYAIKLLIA